MGDTAEIVAKRYDVSREEQDEYAFLSQSRTAAAQEAGLLAEELAPMEVTRGIFNRETRELDGTEEVLFESDECNRPGTTLEGLAGLNPSFFCFPLRCQLRPLGSHPRRPPDIS